MAYTETNRFAFKNMSLATEKKVIPIKGHFTPIKDLVGRVHNTDCISLMSKLRSNSMDMIFADPPFNLKKKYTSYKDNMPLQEYLAWTEEWLVESIRVLKPTGSLFVYNIPRLLTYTANILNEIAEFRHWISWNSNGQPLGKSLQPAHYGILFYTKTRQNKFYDVRAPHEKCRKCDEYIKDYGGKSHLRHEFGYQISDVWNDIHRVRHKCRRISSHPCQLPVHLIERMVLMATDVNDIVLDPFAGSGAAGIASKQLGRRYIGTDIDKGYCREANQRIESAVTTKYKGIHASIFLKKILSIRDIDIKNGKA